MSIIKSFLGSLALLFLIILVLLIPAIVTGALLRLVFPSVDRGMSIIIGLVATVASVQLITRFTMELGPRTDGQSGVLGEQDSSMRMTRMTRTKQGRGSSSSARLDAAASRAAELEAQAETALRACRQSESSSVGTFKPTSSLNDSCRFVFAAGSRHLASEASSCRWRL